VSIIKSENVMLVMSLQQGENFLIVKITEKDMTLFKLLCSLPKFAYSWFSIRKIMFMTLQFYYNNLLAVT
jgi:hypothetical protein